MNTTITNSSRPRVKTLSSKTADRQDRPTLVRLLLVIASTVAFCVESRAVTLTIHATNGSVTADPDKSDYTLGEVVELRPKPNTGYCFTGWSGDARGKSLVLNLTMDSDKTITANFDTWRPPIGIPEPEFGIFETHMMYQDRTYDFGNGPEPYKDAGNGPYTHYVDNTHPNATDSDNPYGTAATPRLTIPLGVPEGSVVEIHGGPYTEEVRGTVFTLDRRVPLQGFGTSVKPVFFRGIVNRKPVIGHTTGRLVYIEGTYIIVENIECSSGVGLWPRGFDGHITHHIAIRCSDIHKEEVSGRGISLGWPHGGCDTHPFYCDPTHLTDVVVYNNVIHDLGKSDWLEWEGQGDPRDSYGVLIHINAYKTWVVDNHIYNIDGDAIHANHGGIDDNTQFPPTLSYIGRNEMHHCRENALDTKVAHDTISSQNKMYDIRKAPGSDGTALVVQTEHETAAYPIQRRAWHLFNEICDSDVGIRIQYSENVYVIGNVIHDIVATQALRDDPWSSGAAIMGWTTQDVSICNNVIYNSDLGILNAGNRDYSEVHIANNVISNLTGNFYQQFGKQPYQVYIGDGHSTPEKSSAGNNLYYQNGEPLAIRWGGTYSSVAEFQQATGQGQGSIQAGPQFMDAVNYDFRLQSSSPAIGAGTSSGIVQQVFDTFESLYGIDIRKDIEGIPRTEPWDIGAHETVAVPNVVGASQSSAESAITSVGLLVGTETSSYSNEQR